MPWATRTPHWRRRWPYTGDARVMHTTLEVPARLDALALVHAHARALASLVGSDAARTAAVELACEEGFSLILDRVDGPSDSVVRMHATITALALEITFDDREIPPLTVAEGQGADAAASLDAVDLAAVARQLIRHSADEARWIPMGRQGNRLSLVFHRRDPDISMSAPPETLVPFSDDAPLAPAQEYVVRVAGAEGADDWAQIARAIYRTYGFTYADDLYIPDRIRELNRAGHVLSIVATTNDGEVVGHYALDVRGFGQLGNMPCATGELGKAVVDPAHRSRGLMERMRRLTEERAHAAGLLAVFSEPTMKHPFSQRANERLGARACAINLGLVGGTVELKGIAVADTAERTSLAVYFQPLVPPAARTIHPPAQHQAMLQRTYDGCGIPVSITASGEPTGDSDITVTFVGGLDFGLIGVQHAGADIGTALRAARDELVRRAGARVIFLDVRLDDAGCAAACAVAEQLGFFYGGLCPHFSAGHDVLRLQSIDVPIAVEQLAVAGPFAREILDYIIADRARVERAGS